MVENRNHDIHEFLLGGYVSPDDGKKLVISRRCPWCQHSGELFCGYYCCSCGRDVNAKDLEQLPEPVAEPTYDQNRRFVHHAAAYSGD
jgi:hypothetical protein